MRLASAHVLPWRVPPANLPILHRMGVLNPLKCLRMHRSASARSVPKQRPALTCRGGLRTESARSGIRATCRKWPGSGSESFRRTAGRRGGTPSPARKNRSTRSPSASLRPPGSGPARSSRMGSAQPGACGSSTWRCDERTGIQAEIVLNDGFQFPAMIPGPVVR